jgi:Fe-S cluster biogenesis protein NfuA
VETTATKEALIQKIESALDTVRPYLAADGGNVQFVDIDEDMNVQLEFVGMCASCSINHMTLKAGLEEAIKKALPEVKSVNANTFI